jgi:hypothetical protein
MREGLVLFNHPARAGEVIKYQGLYWRCTQKIDGYSKFELVGDRADWVRERI